MIKIKESKFIIVTMSLISSVITWILNHKLGLGPIVANGLVGMLAGIFLPGSLAGTVYTASFIGMSGRNMIPSIWGVSLGGFIVGLVLANTKEIYAGLGGKGGTTAALSTLITRAIMNLFA